MNLEPEAIEALKALQRVLKKEGIESILMGALVPHLLIDLDEDLGSRPTLDVDSSVKTRSWREYDRLVNELEKAGFKRSKEEHRVIYGNHVRIDILPYHPQLVSKDRLIWPKSGNEMITIGLKEAFATATSMEISPGLIVSVTSIPAFILLKIAAYTDRRYPRDLVDITYCLEHYEEAPLSDRRYELVGKFLQGLTLKYEEAGAYLLGRDLSQIAEPESNEMVRSFLHQFEDPYCEPIGIVLREQQRFGGNADRRGETWRLFQAMKLGFEES